MHDYLANWWDWQQSTYRHTLLISRSVSARICVKTKSINNSGNLHRQIVSIRIANKANFTYELSIDSQINCIWRIGMTCISKLSKFQWQIWLWRKNRVRAEVLSELAFICSDTTYQRMRGCSLKENRFVDLFRFVSFRSVPIELMLYDFSAFSSVTFRLNS